MFLKLLTFVLLLGTPSTASVKLLLGKLGSQFRHTVSETTKSIEDITKTMSNTFNDIDHLQQVNKTCQTIPHEVETNPKQAESSKHSLNDADWQQFIDVRMAKSEEDERKSIPAEHIYNLQDDVGNITSHVDLSKIDDKEQSQLSQLTHSLLADEKIGHLAQNLNSRHIFDYEQSAAPTGAYKLPFRVTIASTTPIDVKRVPYLDIRAPSILGHLSTTQILPPSGDESLSHQDIKYSRKHTSSLGTFEHQSSSVHKSSIPQALKVHHLSSGNHGHGLDTSLGASGIDRQNLCIYGHPIVEPTVDSSVGGYPNFAQSIHTSFIPILKPSTADKSLSQQNGHQATEDISPSGLSSHQSSTLHELNIPQVLKKHHLSTVGRSEGVSSQQLQQQQLYSLGAAGLARQNLPIYEHPVFQPKPYAFAQRYSNFLVSTLSQPHPSEDKIATNFGYNGIAVPGLVILRQQFTPVDVLWDRLLLLKASHIPLTVYNLHQGFGAAQDQKLLHNRGSFPESDVSSTELPSTTIETSSERSKNGEDVTERGSVTVPSRNIGDHVVDRFINKHEEDRKDQDFIVGPRNGAVEPDMIIFKEDE